MFEYSVQMLHCMMAAVSPFMFAIFVGATAARAYAKLQHR